MLSVVGLVAGILCVWRLRIEGPAHRFPDFGAGDLFGMFMPAYSYEAERLRRLEVPLWNPYQAGGVPFLATLQPGTLYPARLLLLVTDVATAMRWSTIMHILLSAVATHALCRTLGAGAAGSVVGAMTFTAVSAMPLLFAPTFLEASAWLPVAALALVCLVRGGRLTWVVVLGVAAAMPLLAGGHQPSLYIAYCLLLLALALTADRRRRGTVPVRLTLVRLIVATLLAVGLGAPQLLPTLSWARETVRPLSQLTDTQIMPYWSPQIRWSGAWQVVRQTFVGWGGLQTLYLSLPVVVLALVGFCSTGVYGALLGLGALLAYLLAMGPGPPWFVLYRWLPGLALFRLPTRLFLVVTFLSAIGAAHGVTILAGPGRRWIGPVAIGLVLLALVAPVRNDAHLPWTVRASLADPGPLFAAAAKSSGDGRAFLPGDRLDLGLGIFIRQGTLHRIRVLQDYDPLSSRRLAVYLSAVAGDSPPPPDAPLPFNGSISPTRIARPELLDVVAVRSIVLPLGGEGGVAPPWTPFEQAMGYGIYSNPAALPRAYTVTHAQRVDDERQALEVLLATGFDLHREAVLIGGREDPDVAALVDGPATPFRPARFIVDAPERIAVEASAERPALLVLADAFAPGWSARVDGRPAPLWQSNYYVRGVLLPAGTHRVEFDYRPPGFAAGLAVAAGTSGIALAFAAAHVFRRAQPLPS